MLQNLVATISLARSRSHRGLGGGGGEGDVIGNNAISGSVFNTSSIGVGNERVDGIDICEHCPEATTNQATLFCSQCEEPICVACSKIHVKTKKF